MTPTKFGIKQKVRQVTAKAAHASGRIKDEVVGMARSLDQQHQKIADHADTVAKVSKVTAGVAVAGAFVAAPTGLTAVGVAVGIFTAPTIVAVAPILAGAAGVAMTISAATSLYAKAKRRNKKDLGPAQAET